MAAVTLITFVCNFASLFNPITSRRLSKGRMFMVIKAFASSALRGAALTGAGILSSVAATAALT